MPASGASRLGAAHNYDRGMNRALPLLASNDTRATLEFYERLGFQRATPENGLPDHRGRRLRAALRRTHARERAPGSAFVYAEAIDELHQRWAEAGASVTPLTHTNFGMRMFALHDPDGNEIRVGWPPR